MIKLDKSILTGGPLESLFSLGSLCISNFYSKDSGHDAPKLELELGFCAESGLVQLTSQPDASLMWGDTYWYKSGTNQFMRDALENVVVESSKFVKWRSGDVWLDIAANDGTLLSYAKGFFRIGIDPSAYPEASNNSELIVKDYFSKEVYPVEKKAKVVTCCAMFYDLHSPIELLKDVKSVLAEDGVFVLQLSYTPAMLIQYEVGNILHEHVAYYTLKSLEYALEKAGLKICDLELNNVNGGSIRVYCHHTEVDFKFKTRADMDIATIRVQSLRDYEAAAGYNDKERYLQFFEDMKLEREKFLNFLKQEKAAGKTFYGYGASSKGNTVLQWYGLTGDDVVAIAERQERKHGLECAGSRIPVCSESQARLARPDYMIVFPWHFIGEFKERESEYLKSGGKFVVLSPKFEVIGYED
jgi:SAM-dependent methyltransferase